MVVVLSIVGTRPEIIQAAPVSRALRDRCREVLVHTGQHYDSGMSDVFFADLDLIAPDHHLGVGSGSHGEQTAGVLLAVERVIREVRPDIVFVRGDTNSGLGAALAAAKLGVPVAHAEAGPRSGNRSVPEEINRLLMDHVADLNFAPTPRCVENLAAEGITSSVHLTGDVTADSIRIHSPRARALTGAVLARIGLPAEGHYLATIHRPSNTDDRDRLAELLAALRALGRPVLFPVHPRTLGAIARWDLTIPDNVLATGPLPYVELLAVLGAARACITDSGGLQKEAYLLGTPCVTLRTETEWPETVEAGWNRTVPGGPDRVAEAARIAGKPAARADLFGDGHAAERMADLLLATGE